VAGVLGRQTGQAPQTLRKILADKIELEQVGSGRQRRYKFRGALSLEKIIEGEAMKSTPVKWWPQRDAIELAEFKCAILLRAEVP
jgi:hypothetical protein